MQKIRLACLAATPTIAALLALPRPAAAASPFELNLNVDGQTYTRNYNDLSDLLSLLNRGALQRIAPNYTSGSQVNAEVNVRGVPMTVSTVDGDPTALRLTSPDADYERVFDAGSLSATQRQLQEFAKGNENGEELKQLVKAVVANSTADPVAGNPSSLLGQSVIADYTIGTLLPGDDGGMAPRAAGWHFSIGAAMQQQSASSFDIDTYSLPIGASYTFGVDGPEVFLHIPLFITDTAGATSYMGTGAVGVRVPIVRTPQLRWALTPSIRWGAAGSDEVGAVGATYGGSLTSDLRIALGNMTLGIGNSIARYQTSPLKVGEYNIKYDLQNWSYRNGVSLTAPVGELGGQPVSLGVSFIDTRMTGDALAVDSWQEYGISASFGSTMPLRFSASYLDGERGYHGFRLGVTASF
ncbi:hypothetical protein [Roseomonas marmotae]|uniref:Autotransporter outer membrane beta-barrel domain-containing protein n=1 Tax=Roseomonas marmotae TaxID=2768161 RepID=A0ABS3K9Q0_9PROT|nr:hypothetical protein [Roseomonas marmotae]MBO1074183.1 hypothetical protein [Roseomonas marmotae]QTI78957.1 hypothetical protein IAI58_15120 [Roseomonas marmotae]